MEMEMEMEVIQASVLNKSKRTNAVALQAAVILVQLH
jgi:hypothetical protein